MRCFQKYIVVFVVSVGFGQAVHAQSFSGEWTGDFALPGVTSSISSIAEGSEHLYVGGSFLYAGNVLTSRLAYYDFAEMAWRSLDPPTGEADLVSALTVGPEGKLYVADAMTTGGGVTTILLSYDPQTEAWVVAEGEIDGVVQALVIGPDGTLYVGGDFDEAGGLDVPYLARYDFNEAEWSPVSSGINGFVEGLASDGEYLYVGGSFTEAGSEPASQVARYNPAADTWSALGGGVGTEGGVSVFAFGQEGVYVGGRFNEAYQPDGTSLTVHNAALWNPDAESWSPVLDAGTERVATLSVGADGMLQAIGETAKDGFLYWDGTDWDSLDLAPLGEYPVSGQQEATALLAVEGRIYFGFLGAFFFEGNNPNNFLYWYEPGDEAWGLLGNDQTNGFTDDVLALATAPGGEVYVGGRFHFAGIERAAHVARWNGEAWAPLGQGVAQRLGSSVEVLLYDRSGNVYVGGRFDEIIQADGTAVEVSSVARWDSHAEMWHAVGGGVYGIVRAFAEAADGSVVVGGLFEEVYQPDGTPLEVESLARWDPETETWEDLPEGHGFVGVQALAEDEAGALYVGGYRIIPPMNKSRAFVARLDPETDEWTTLQEWAETLGVYALSVEGDPTAGGTLYAGTYQFGVWQWKNEMWTELGGPEFVYSLALNGDPEAGGELYAGGVNADASGPYVQRWDGESWSGLGSGLTSFVSPPLVHALAVGEAEAEGKVALWVGGEFIAAGSEPASCIARWETEGFGTDAEEGGSVPQALGLEAYPNPASGPLTVRYALPASSAVRIAVYDVLGREVAVLADAVQSAGTHEVMFVQGGLASGVYVVWMEAGTGAARQVRTQRVTVLR